MIQEGNTYYLNGDVEGPYSRILYASKGDKVLLIAIHNTMAVVEFKTVRFPLKIERLSDEEQTRTPDETKTVTEINHPKKRINKKAKSHSSKLF
ncbi:MAG: hypothetical protein ACJ749_06795 [Flavisolibacter sp.]|jgi:hypothetical protein